MKVEYWLFGGGVFVFAPFGVIYGFFTHWQESVGVAGLFLAAGLSALVGFYLWWTARKLDDRPEDDPAAPISAAEGEYGFFSPHSWWPLPLAAGAALIFLGLAVGWWHGGRSHGAHRLDLRVLPRRKRRLRSLRRRPGQLFWSGLRHVHEALTRFR